MKKAGVLICSFILLCILNASHSKPTHTKRSQPTFVNNRHVMNVSGLETTCRIVPYTMVITHKNCHPKKVEVNSCYGHCNSIFLPGDKGYQNTLSVCTKCKPKTFHWKIVKLRCSFLIHKGRKQHRRRRRKKFEVQIYDSCHCTECSS